MFSIEEIIDLAIRIEENGEKVYRGAVEKASTPSLAALLRWLADEELRHIEWFSQLKKGVNKTAGDPRAMELGRRILQGVVGSQSFSLEEADFSKLEQRRDLLKVAIEFEKDTVLFYEMLHPLVEDEDGIMKKIMSEEKRHIEVLQECLDEAAGNGPRRGGCGQRA